MRNASSSNTNKLANPFLGKTKAEMKKIYDNKIRNSGKSGAELRKIATQMQAALKQAPKPKPAKPAKPATPARSSSSSSPSRTRKQNTATSQRITDAMVADANKKRSKKTTPQSNPSRSTSRPVSGRNALAMRQYERNRNRKDNPLRGVKNFLSKAAENVDKTLKLTYKKGDKKKINGITYVHNGKRFVRYTL